MTSPLLALLTAAIAVLLCLGGIGGAWRRQAPRIAWSAAALAGLIAGLALLDLLLGLPAAAISLPIGLPDVAFRLLLDPLAAFFILLLFTAAAGSLGFLAATSAVPPVGGVSAVMAALGLAVLGANGLIQAAGLAVAGAVIWTMNAPGRQAAIQLGITLLAAAAVIAATAAPVSARLWAALLGPGILAGLVPFHLWGTPADRPARPLAALVSGGLVPTALYLMLRLLFPAAIVPPAWWTLPLLLLGTAAAMLGGLHGLWAADIDTALAAGTVRQMGLATLGLGVAVTARAADLPAVVNMALAAVFELATLQALVGTLLAAAAGAIRDGAGTGRLDRLGGLIHRMPVTTRCWLGGLLGLAALPPAAGFAVIWLLFHAVLGLPHSGGVPSHLMACAMVAVLGMASALSVADALRLVGVVCLGRPRTPRTAVADEPPRGARLVLLGLTAAVCACGAFVGPLLQLLASAPVLGLSGAPLGPLVSWQGLAPGTESPGYAALPIAALLLLATGTVLGLVRSLRLPPVDASGAAWEGGFAAPPNWLPFGDPTTQTAGAGFAPAWLAAGFATAAAWMATPVAVAKSVARSPVTPIPAATGAGANFRRAARATNAPAIVLIVLAALLALCVAVGTP